MRGVTDLLGRTFFAAFQKFLGSSEFFFCDSTIVAGFRFSNHCGNPA